MVRTRRRPGLSVDLPDIIDATGSPMKPAIYLAVSAALAILFLVLPGLDIEAARLFHRIGTGFFLEHHPLVTLIYDSILVLEILIAGLVALMILAWAIPALRRFRVRGAVIAYIALSFLLGPALVTNEILKNNIGRARPAQVVEFGKQANFTPAFVISDQCKRNCAFVSGHASLGFAMITFAFLAAPGIRRRISIVVAVGFGTAVGIGRMMQGAHWLSDVIFAALINIAIAWALYQWIVRRDGLGFLFNRRGGAP
ncbi:MAG: lipid A 4'-phosphatase [Alphaproteobacteria bacterium]|jgi:lipid A 4'-phosphatase